MSMQLNPVIADKLTAFARRRFRLILIRGVCAGLLTLLAVMTTIAIVDWLILLPEKVRWAMSGAGYLAVAAVVYATCVRLIARVPSATRLARLIESVEPGLREDLISAVELSDDESPMHMWESPVFRRLLQEDVAQRMQGVDVDRLLPSRLIAGWQWTAVGVLALVLVLICIPGLRFNTLMYRALVPIANVDRVSRTQVHVLAPDPVTPTVPFNEPVGVVVQLTGDEADDVQLQTFVDGKASDKVRMTAAGDRRFQTTLHVGRQDVEYRVTAGDAVTRRYLISARPRPAATTFHKAITFPQYAQLASKTVTEKSGDLVALQGSTVALTIETDQPVSSAYLSIQRNGEAQNVTMVTDDGGRLHAKVPMDESGTYRVNLVARDTGFQNKYSPDYELRAEPDLIPRVEITDPTQNVLVTPDEVLDLRGTAGDDLMLAKVVQAIRINGGAWTEIPLLTEPTKETDLHRVWDLYDMALEPGDRVTTRLIATDLKGSTAQSKLLQVVVSSREFDPRRLQQLAVKRRAFDAFSDFASNAEETRNYVNKAEDLTRNRPAGDAQRLQAMIEATDAVARLNESAENAVLTIKQTLREAVPGREAHDMTLAARTLIESVAGALPAAQAELRAARQAGDQQAAAMKRAQDQMNKVVWHAVTGRDLYGRVFGADVTAVVAAHLSDLRAHQQRINQQAAQGDAQSGATW